MSIALTIDKTHSDICQKAAEEIARLVKDNPSCSIGLATGNTMEPIYDALVKKYEAGELDFSKVKFFNLDEYKGLEAGQKQSFDYYLKTLFLNKINAQPENIHLVSGIDFDCDAYEQKIKETGGIDIQLLGIGREGHIGFNEVGKSSTRDSRTREVELAKTTLEDSASSFSGQSNVPRQAYTQGIGTILDAKRLIMIVNGGHKAKIAQEMLAEGSIEALPARAIQQHPHCSLYMDVPATEMLTAKQLSDNAKMEKAAIEKLQEHFKPIFIPLEDGNTLALPHNADIYLPDSMAIDEKFDVANSKHIASFQKMLRHVKETYVGAHQDDTELWVPQAIEANDEAQEQGKPNQFLTIIATDGAAYTSALKREGKFSKMTPEQLIAERKREQRNAARNMKYPVIQLQYPSNSVKGFLGEEKSTEIVNTLSTIYNLLPQHETAYTHHPVDIHKTHTACATLSIQALRNSLKKPAHVYGMPAWGETGIYDKIFPLKRPELINEQLKKFPSQIEMQKRAYGVNGEGAARGKGFLYDPHENSPPDGAAIGIELTEAMNKNTSLQMVIKQAYAKKIEKHSKMLDDFAAPQSPEAAHRRIGRTTFEIKR